MIKLEKYNKYLREIIASSNTEGIKQKVNIDELDSILREYLPIKDMRDAGSFFTGHKLANEVLLKFPKNIDSNSVVLDPSCGAGNLLLVCSRQLEVKNTLTETLKYWGGILWGFDIYSSFIDAAKLRLIIEALYRGAIKDCELDIAFNILSNIKVKDALLVKKDELVSVTHSIMNPPFTIWPSPKENFWKSGKVNAAGIFIDRYSRILPDNCQISAILPEVLRSGSRYACLRESLSKNIDGVFSIWGRFNKKTDVDVFILYGKIARSTSKNIVWVENLGNYTTLSELYDVRVGPLVSYRDPELGDEHAYFHAKNSPAWKTVSISTEKRKFDGTLLKPPFVLVKRTSSPTDRYRASATLVNLKEYVAVENHMIVITPKSATLKDCKKLMAILKSSKTNVFLNKRIRLRHLTVSVMKELPLT